jgi:DmsE family decaheme c-type cytochrome
VSSSRGDSDVASEAPGVVRPLPKYDPIARRVARRKTERPAVQFTWEEKQYPPVTATIPTIPGAQMLNDDSLCMTCHEGYTKYHQTNVHRAQSCETCHGPASQHLRTRGTEPGTILSFKKMKTAEQSEVCLKCHEKDGCMPGQKWRTSVHAYVGLSCMDCHKSHYNVPPGTPPTKVAENSGMDEAIRAAAAQEAKEGEVDMQAIRAASQSMGAAKPETCYRCHQQKAEMQRQGHPHEIGGPHGFKCATCHDPHGSVTRASRTEVCMQCHKGHPEWHGSRHAQSGMACVDCHNPHSGAPALGAAEPQTCYRCHKEQAELERVAHPHQINGPNGFKCATCHNPHGNITKATLADNCLECHKGNPTMAWHSSTHAQYNVACADCHNAHPSNAVQRFVDIHHTHVRRDKRLPMSVNQPFVCYQCHPKTAAQFELPSHHPVREGKMVCSDCHDSHGGQEKNLREPTVNLVCYRCHADKQGPFVWQHPPVEENCAICHNPHGTVANNLLHQPTTFLCLRCHSGHREFRRNPDRNVYIRQPFFTDCTICHAQVHGSDLPAATLTPRLTR